MLTGALLEILPLLALLPLVRATLWPQPLRSQALVWLLLGLAVACPCRWVVIGYLRRVARDALRGEARELPPWDRFGDDLAEGCKLWIVMLAMGIPTVVFSAVCVLAIVAAGLSSLAWVALVVVLPPTALATLLYLPAALLLVIDAGDPSAAFSPRVVLARVAGAPGPYLLGFLFGVTVEILAQSGLLAACIGVFVTRFAAHVMTVHYFAGALAVHPPAPRADEAAG